jgi:hypothetical protein
MSGTAIKTNQRSGRIALHLPNSEREYVGWMKPGQLLTGLSPNIDPYIFVVAIDSAGKSSKPGTAFKVKLKDMLPMR